LLHTPGFQTPSEEIFGPQTPTQKTEVQTSAGMTGRLGICLHFIHSWGSFLLVPWITEECSLWMELPEVCLAGYTRVGHWCGPWLFIWCPKKSSLRISVGFDLPDDFANG